MQEEAGNDGDVDVVVEEHGRAQQKWWEKRAHSLVRVHTTSLREKAARTTRPKRWASLPRFQNFHDGQLDEKTPSNQDRDIEFNMNATSHISPLPRGQGVLSTLLTLYHTGGSLSSSPPTSHATTPGDSGRQSPAMPGEPEEHQKQQEPPTSYFDPHAPTATGVSPLPDIPAPAPSTSPGPLAKKKNTFHIPLPMPPNTPLSLHLPSPAMNVHLPTLHTPGTRGGRPKAATNAGGVVGSLIATSGNLTGAAAPVPSTIGPHVKKKGFRLSRSGLLP